MPVTQRTTLCNRLELLRIDPPGSLFAFRVRGRAKFFSAPIGRSSAPNRIRGEGLFAGALGEQGPGRLATSRPWLQWSRRIGRHRRAQPAVSDPPPSIEAEGGPGGRAP